MTLTRLLLIGAIAWATLSGCALFQKPPHQPVPKLLPPIQGPVGTQLKQIVTLYTQNVAVQFLAISQFDPKITRVLILWPSGQPVISIVYDGVQLQEQAYGKLPISGTDILSALQFNLWPARSLRQLYTSAEGWDFKMTSAPEHRTLNYLGKPWLDTHTKDMDTVELTHHHNEYRLLLRKLPPQPQSPTQQ